MDASAGDVAAGRRRLLDRWPTAAGLVASALVLVTEPELETVAISVSVAAMCYLGAAALQRRWVAWAGIVAASAVVVVGEVAGLAWWAALGLVAVVLVGVGAASGAARRPLAAETLALLVFGGCAVLAVFVSGAVGLALGGSALALHAGWDLAHYRRDVVVPRSMAEACLALDVPVGLGAVALAVFG